MGLNLLKLNDDKTEFIIFAPKYRQHLYRNIEVTAGDCVIRSEAKVKNLGVILDNKLSLEDHVNAVSRTCHFHLRNISRIHRYLSEDACRTIIQSLVISRLDYCNVLLNGLLKIIISKLQRVQNTAAHIIARTPRAEHITPVLMDLHWLPIEKRIHYKVLLHTYT